jgi:hypothetical protein
LNRTRNSRSWPGLIDLSFQCQTDLLMTRVLVM